MESNDAKVAFVKAMVKVQGTLSPVGKDSVNPHFKSKYASLEAVNAAIMGPLTEAGFIVLAGGHDINGKPYLRTTLTHAGGHSESFDYPLIEKTENPQHIASSVTYARRYSLCALLNLSVEDDDGNAAAAAKPAASSAVKSAPASGGDSVTFVPHAVSSKPTKTGGTSHSVKLPDGRYASTFDDATAKVLTQAKAELRQVKVYLLKKGDFWNIVGVDLLGGVQETEPIPEESFA